MSLGRVFRRSLGCGISLSGATKLRDLTVVVTDRESCREFFQMRFWAVPVASFGRAFERLLDLDSAEAAHQFLDVSTRAHGRL